MWVIGERNLEGEKRTCPMCSALLLLHSAPPHHSVLGRYIARARRVAWQLRERKSRAVKKPAEIHGSHGDKTKRGDLVEGLRSGLISGGASVFLGLRLID
jgi:hypothetical protein